ncbi:hypothetical protein EV140_2460 [Microcella alkaliphila]|uniref:Uncharacterized protein n=1 Tax=Microcella alkaliphila TaxID=279828 RepID=A0A4Q7TEI7_9MICO|nr:hypothetical protein [Microcella alkaliphila]RZT58217.1 hypothetical protein EV140_2460 [Microcella alkaliphila]
MNNNQDDLDGRLTRSLAVGAPDLSSDIVTGAPGRRAPRMVNRGRVAQVAAGSLTAVAAVSVGALVIGGSLTGTQPPLFVAASGGDSRIAGAEAATSFDSMPMPWVQYEYVAGDGLSGSGGTGAVYQLQRTGTPDDVLRAVAAQFGVGGSPERSEWYDETYPSYVVGPEDGSAPVVTLSWIGTGNWWYSNPLPYVENPPQPSLAPTGSEAQSLAAEIFAAGGLTIDPAAITLWEDDWQTTATGHLVVNGQRTALEWAVSWAPTGDIQWASGHSIEVVDRGSFGTVSARDAVDRLDDWRWSAAPGPDYQGDMAFIAADASASSGMARSEVELVEPQEPSEELVAPDLGDGSAEPLPGEPGGPPVTVEPGDDGAEPLPQPEPAPEPMPVPEPEPLPEPEVVTVTVDAAESTLLLMWDADGNAWLVPGYAVEMPDGWFAAVVSLVEGVIALPEPIEYGIMPIEEPGGTEEDLQYDR